MVARFEVRDELFRKLVPDGARVEQIATGFGFTEGPVWVGDHLLFSDIPNNAIMRWEEQLLDQDTSQQPGQEQGAGRPRRGFVRKLTTFRHPVCQFYGTARGGSNGLTLDAQGRLLACEHGARRVSITEADGTVTTFADSYQGMHLNSPNDIVARPDGSVYFTDPPYGMRDQSEGKEMHCNGVFHRAPDGTLTLLVEDFERPNGLAISPDGRTIYIDDTARGHIRAFDLGSDGTITNGRVFADIRSSEPGVPDGMKLDSDGNIWCTGAGGVWVIAPSGTVLGRILMPEVTANLAWGGDGNRTLYLTSSTSLCLLECAIAGQALSSI
jgi:gluconolactonase